MKKIYAVLAFLSMFVSVPAFAWEWPWSDDSPITSLRKSGLDKATENMPIKWDVDPSQSKSKCPSGLPTGSVCGVYVSPGQSLLLLSHEKNGKKVILVFFDIASKNFKLSLKTRRYVISTFSNEWRSIGKDDSGTTKEEVEFMHNAGIP